MTIKEKKRKLSEILGINLFEPKYKEIDSILTEEDTEAEKEAVSELEQSEESTGTEESASEIDVEDTGTESEDELESEEAEDSTTEQSEEQTEADEDGGDHADGEEQDNKTTDDDTRETDETDVDEANGQTDMQAELFDAKLEAKLLRAGVREDKLDAAKKLFKADHTLNDIDKVEKWIKSYPEWTKQRQSEPAKAFGMDVGGNEIGETAEEKRLRELGII